MKSKEQKLAKFHKLTKSYQHEINYCGCCGIEIPNFDNWCDKCMNHVDHKSMRPIWDITYYAINGKDCPFQIKS